MGEIADMMLDGTMCECCGEFMGSEGEGFPRYCSPECAADRGMDFDELDSDDDEENPSVANIQDYLDITISSIEIAIGMVKALKLKGKARELSWLIKRINQYKQKLEE